jgi:predicted esterase
VTVTGARAWRHGRVVACLAALLTLGGPTAVAQRLPPGEFLANVSCADDPTERYALYLPSDYSPDRTWSLLLAFHPGANGAVMVARYQAAAERYGYVVAGSNTSRNGPWDVSAKAVRAMSRDVGQRFTIDADRVYITGLSGGARVAMEVALGNRAIAGVIASSAGFPDVKPRKSVRFPVFATAGIDDFNYLEMRALDDALESPHRLAIFDGGHTLPPAAVALDAVEWLELQAMRTKRRAIDPALVDALLSKRRRQVDAEPDTPTRLRLLRELVADFAGLRDTDADAARRTALEADADARRAVAGDRSERDQEARALDEVLRLESRLAQPGTRGAALARLSDLLDEWAQTAASPEISTARTRARRLLGGIAAGAASRVEDPEYTALVRRHRWR